MHKILSSLTGQGDFIVQDYGTAILIKKKNILKDKKSKIANFDTETSVVGAEGQLQ